MSDDLLDSLRGHVNAVLFVHHHVVVVVFAGQLQRGVALPNLELLGRLGPPGLEMLDQGLHRRRQNEDQESGRDLALHDLRTLDVDLEDGVLAARQGVPDAGPWRAVPVRKM